MVYDLGGGTFDAVSYTHLDVYKRQAKDSVKIRRKAVERSIASLTSLDTANAVADLSLIHI